MIVPKLLNFRTMETPTFNRLQKDYHYDRVNISLKCKKNTKA